MGTTQPIREEDQVKEFTNYYKNICPSARNQALIIFSLNTALRISDLLSLKWEDIYDFETEQIVRHLYITEHKTKKQSIIVLNTRIQEAQKLICRNADPSVRNMYSAKIRHIRSRSTVRRHTGSSAKPPMKRCICRISAAIPCARHLATTHGSTERHPHY